MTSATIAAGIGLSIGQIPAGFNIHDSSTIDVAGFSAVTYSDIGVMASISGVGEEFGVGEYTDITSATKHKSKGIRQLPSVSLTVTEFSGDAGQNALKDAFNSKANYVFKITDSNSDEFYFVGLVTKFDRDFSDENGPVTLSFDVAGNSKLYSA